MKRRGGFLRSLGIFILCLTAPAVLICAPLIIANFRKTKTVNPDFRVKNECVQYTQDKGKTWDTIITLSELMEKCGVTGQTGIKSVTEVPEKTDDTKTTYKITFHDNTVFEFEVKNGEDGKKGEDGKDGRGIKSIYKDTANSTDEKSVYVIMFDDDSTYSFEILNGTDGTDGTDGTNGEDGKDGSTISIGDNGNWFIDGVDTGKPAIGTKGDKGDSGKDGVNGNGIKSITINQDETDATKTTYIITFDNNTTYSLEVKNGTNGTDGEDGKDGKDGSVVTIGEDGYWYIDGVKTDVKAVGSDGKDGTNGEKGVDGREVEFQKTATHIQWRYKTEDNSETWTNLIALEDLKGSKGDQGIQGEKGVGIKSITIDETRSDSTKTTYVITFDNDTTFSYEIKNGTNGANGTNGENGVDGREVEFQTTATHIQWRYKTADNSETWTNLIAINLLKGDQGEQGTQGEQGVQGEKGDKGDKGDQGEQGEAGNGIKSITIDATKTDSTKTTYVITFTDNTTFSYVVLNGVNGTNGTNGKDGKDGSVVTIGDNGNWFIDGQNTGIPARGADGTNGTNGENGVDGREVEFQTTATHIQWRYKTEDNSEAWTNLIAINLLKGEKGDKGDKGDQGEQGEDGNGIKSITIDATKTDSTKTTYVITFTDNTTFSYVVLNGVNGTNGTNGENGVDGREVEFQTTATHIQWRYKTEDNSEAWTNLIAINLLKGEKGDKGDKGDQGEQGEDGNGIKSITIDATKTDSTKTTYVITFTDNTTFSYVVLNGINGTNGTNGTDGEDGKDGKDGSVVTIGEDGYWYIDGVKTDVKAVGSDGTNGTNGENGVDGREVEFQTTATHIQWRYKTEDNSGAWTNLIAINLLKGDQGEQGTQGEQGEAGNGIKSITIDATKTDSTKTTYVITFTDNTTFSYVVLNGVNGTNGTNGENGVDGREVEFQTTATHIQWRYKTEDNSGAWTNLIAINLLKGQDGTDVDVDRYTLTYEYGVAGDFFKVDVVTNALKTTETVKSTQWLDSLPEIKDAYIEGFKGWFIQGTDIQISEYDFIGRDTTLEPRFHFNEYAPAGLYENGEMIKNWAQLVDEGTISLSEEGTTIECCGCDTSIQGDLIISNKITTIDWMAFDGCVNLFRIIVPNSVQIIGQQAFENIGLIEIIISNSIEIIEPWTFARCTGLTEIRIPDSVKTIGAWAFEGCTGLTEINIPSSVTTIDDGAFHDCTNLKMVIIDSATIANGFTGANSQGDLLSNATTVYIKTGLDVSSSTYLAEGFSNISSDRADYDKFVSDVYTVTFDYAGLETYFETTPLTITVKSNEWITTLPQVESTCASLFKGWFIQGTDRQIRNYDFIGGNVTLEARLNAGLYSTEGFTPWNELISTGIIKLSSSDSTEIEDCDSSIQGDLIIEDGILSIGFEAFNECRGLTTITIPSSVTTIGVRAFYFCTGLTEINIPSSVTTIGDYAFYNCTELTTITIPNSVTTIGDYAFSSCIGLTTITIPNSVTTIGDYVFHFCTGLTEINIPNSVTTIGDYAFNNTGLTTMTIPNSVTTIGSYAFHFCTGLTEINIPNSVTTIGDYAFYSCEGLTEINIPNSVITIGSNAFHFCTGLTEINIPSSVTTIGNSAFSGCRGLESITVDSGNSEYRSEGNCLIKGNELIVGCKNSTIPSSVTTIGNYAFSGCTGLTEIIIGSSVNLIGTEAFYGCTNLKTVVIDSETIANGLTSSSSQGNLLSNATTVYIKSDLEVSSSTYLKNNYSKQTTSDRVGYNKYVKNAS